jgi:hypothetical protein
MGKIVFISSVVFTLIFFISFILKIRRKKSKLEGEIEKKLVVKIGTSNDTGVLMIPGIIVLLILAIYWWSTRLNPNSRTAPIIVKQVNTVQIQVRRQQEEKQERRREEIKVHAIVHWDKPDGVAGLNPHQRSMSVRATIIHNNQNIMEFSTPGGSIFHWDKRKKYGEWYDTEGAGGQWRLEGTGNKMEGVLSDAKGTFIPMWLEFY